MEPKDRLYVAIDSDGGEIDPAHEGNPIAKKLTGRVGGFKIGSALFDILGLITGGHAFNPIDSPILLDLKWWDTPDTMRAVGKRLVDDYAYATLSTVHARSGVAAMRALRRSVDETYRDVTRKFGEEVAESLMKPKLIAVTVLTSERKNTKRVIELAEDALAAGMDGITCPPYAIRAVKKRFGDKLLIVVPGIRFRKSKRDNHVMVATPFEAIRDGADYIVMGRPITKAKDPVSAARRAVSEIERGEKERKR